MRLDKIEDHRSPLAKLTRTEFLYLARKEGRHIDPQMPVELMRNYFRSEPPSTMPRPMAPPLGSQRRLTIPPYDEWLRIAFGEREMARDQPDKVEEVDATSDLARQWERQKAAAASAPASTSPGAGINELRKECKRRGIKVERTDKTADLRAKLDG